MSASDTVNSRASGYRCYQEPYLWRGGRFLMLYTLIIAGLGAASIIWLL